VLAEVASVNTRPMRQRRGSIFEAVVTDGHGRLTLTFFGRGNQRWMEDRLQPGVRGLFSGQVSSYRGKRQLAHPDYELLGAGSAGARAEEYANEIIPIYPATARLPSWKIAGPAARGHPRAARAARLRRRAARHPPAGR